MEGGDSGQSNDLNVTLYKCHSIYRVAQNKRPITFYVINVLVIDIFA